MFGLRYRGCGCLDSGTLDISGLGCLDIYFGYRGVWECLH